MALGDADGCAAGMASPSSSVSNIMPWEWVLENLLDVRGLSRPFLKELIGYIPHIEEPRCSRLLQKVALLYLDDVVVSRKVDTCAIPLIRFILKEQGVSNMRRIHSLKESCENDLILRVETEVVLANLRCDTKEGEKDWEAYEDALENIFPEDASETQGAERRKELIAVIEDRIQGDPQRDACEQLLGKYSLEELIKDIAQFIEDKKRLFKTKFLDQLAKDVDSGVYHIASTFGPDSPEGNDQPNGHHEVPHFSLRGDERITQSNQTTNHASSTTFPGNARDVIETGLESNDGTNRPGSTSVPCEDGMRQNEDEDCTGRNRFAKVRAEMCLRMAEVDKFAGGIASEIKDAVNEISKFAEDVHKAVCLPESTLYLNNVQLSGGDASLARNPVFTQLSSETELPVGRAEVDVDEAVDDYGEPGTHVDHHLPSQGDFSEGCTAGDTISLQKNASIDTGVKRMGDERLEQFRDVAKKVKFDESEGQECEGQSEVRKMSRLSNMRKEVEEPVKDGLSCESDDTVVIMVDEDFHVTRERGWNYRKRKYLWKMSAGLEAGPAKFASTAGDSKLVEGNGEGELNARCYLCSGGGGCQMFCRGCPVSVHKSCHVDQVGYKSYWYCPWCEDSRAREAVTQAKEDVKKAKETVRKAREEAVKTQGRLVAFLSARGASCYYAHDDLVEHRQRTSSSISQAISKEDLKAMYPKKGSTEDFVSEPERVEKTTALKTGIRGTTGATISPSRVQSSVWQGSTDRTSHTGMDMNIQTLHQAAAPNEEVKAVRSNPAADPRDATDRQESPRVPSPVLQRLAPGDERRCASDVKELSEGMEILKELVPPMAAETVCKSGPSEEASKDLGTDFLKSTGRDSTRSNYPPLNGANPGAEEGDGHDGDLDEVCEGKKADADGAKCAEQIVDTEVSEAISDVPNVEAKPRRGRVYRGRKQIPGVRRRNLPWTTIEIDVLKEGVKKFSNNGRWGFQWKRILEFGDGKFDKSRTTVDLKDKWRNLVKDVGVS